MPSNEKSLYDVLYSEKKLEFDKKEEGTPT